MFSVSPFVLDPVPHNGAWRLFTPLGAARVNDSNLVAALEELSTLRPLVSTDDVGRLLESRNLPATSAQQFLEQLKILRPINKGRDVIVFSPSAVIASGVAELILSRDSVSCRYCTKVSEIGDGSIILAIQDKYDVGISNELYAACNAKKEQILLHSYFVFRHFVIDGFYSASIDLPDHISGLHNIAGLDRTSKFKPTSWADFFLADPYAVETLAIPTFPAADIEICAALHLFYTRARPLLAEGVSPLFPDDLGTVIELNLDTGRVERHRGVHSNFSPSLRNI